MDIDDDSHQHPSPHSTNALAGPSTIPTPPTVFLPPPAPPVPPVYLRSTQDLLARFQLLAAYDKHVRPGISPVENVQDHVPLPPPGTSGKGKGKEKEKELQIVASPTAMTPGVDGADADDDDGGHGEKKKKNNYKHLIKGIPGKHSTKKDSYLTTIIQVPPKQRIPIIPFDAKTQGEAFTVSLDGLRGWNPSLLVLESPQAREDRKRRKELKKLAKAQLPTLAPVPSSTSPPSNLTPTHASSPTTSQIPPARTSTPKPGIPHPGSRQMAQSPLASTGLGHVNATMLTSTPIAHLGSDKDKRGRKRDHEEVSRGGQGENIDVTVAPTVVGGAGAGVVGINGSVVNGMMPKAVVNLKAGLPGVRPRPIKKQRMDIQGQARDVTVPVQQPTPQGV